MSRIDAADLAQRLGQQAEAVCRTYLSNGHRQGNYWQVGDVRNTAGRSMFVRLTGPTSGKGAAGKWQDPSEGTHGDLLDVIRESLGLSTFADVLEEARRFISLPQLESVPNTPTPKQPPAPSGSSEAARRLLSMSSPLKRSLAATYLRGRGITNLRDTDALKYLPNCYYRGQGEDQTKTWPAMIAAVTDLAGKVTGVHRTWIARDGGSKAPVDTQRKAMGGLLGHAVRFGVTKEVMAAGEGIETVLSLRQALPKMPMVAALSAGHLTALVFPADLRRLYIVRDNDPAGDGARDSLVARAFDAGIEAITLSPMLGDFNDDLVTRGPDALRAHIRVQLAPEDVSRFLAQDHLTCRTG
ncbi:Toprim domain-containing protein [Gemmobacter caeni]|uniref:Toprim domain-containing protein n=1 Tax=Gemmobacter caeni TaxID=589035 RepID=A0A2T6ABF1_9RHOB|nr:toprim domain-containing protein [Gemmobacter caeni]PTX41153.1 Toprim domain-containing protein [Gemmobacter caeni]TWI93888.1 Toprim domain-containing protein [Gemmobacter caeni]